MDVKISRWLNNCHSVFHISPSFFHPSWSSCEFSCVKLRKQDCSSSRWCVAFRKLLALFTHQNGRSFVCVLVFWFHVYCGCSVNRWLMNERKHKCKVPLAISSFYTSCSRWECCAVIAFHIKHTKTSLQTLTSTQLASHCVKYVKIGFVKFLKWLDTARSHYRQNRAVRAPLYRCLPLLFPWARPILQLL